MKILVTGGAGYIGSVTVKKLVEAGYQVTVLDNLENGHAAAVDPRAFLIKGDLRDKFSLAQIVSSQFGAVIHFAGYIESGESMSSPLKFFENNFSAGINLLMALKSAGLERIVFSSTAGIYGSGQSPLTEMSPVNPTSNYSLSKYFLERALWAASQAEKFKVVVLRYFNAAGASSDGRLGEAHPRETHLIPLAIKAAQGIQSPLYLYGTDYQTADGTAVRDYVHVEDLAAAHILSLGRLRDLGEEGFFEVFNVGTGEGVSNREVIEMVRKVSGRNFEVVEKPRRAGDWDVSFADASKIKRELGWQASYHLEEIVRSAWIFHKNNPYGFKKG